MTKTMTVQELIKQLENVPKDMPVVIPGYEGGCDYVDTFEEVEVDLNVNTEWYYGSHEPNNEQQHSDHTSALVNEGPTTVLWISHKGESRHG